MNNNTTLFIWDSNQRVTEMFPKTLFSLRLFVRLFFFSGILALNIDKRALQQDFYYPYFFQHPLGD